MDLDLTRKSLNLSLHLVVLEDEYLSLLRLMLKLGCQLMILQDSQPCRCLELLIVHGKKISFGLLDIEEHLLS